MKSVKKSAPEAVKQPSSVGDGSLPKSCLSDIKPPSNEQGVKDKGESRRLNNIAVELSVIDVIASIDADYTIDSWQMYWLKKLNSFGLFETGKKLSFAKQPDQILAYIEYLGSRFSIKDSIYSTRWWVVIRRILTEMDSLQVTNIVQRSIAETFVELSMRMEEFPFVPPYLELRFKVLAVQLQLAEAMRRQ